MNKDELSLTEFWGKMAPHYDDYVASTRYDFFNPKEEADFFDHIFEGSDSILDIGCGTGRTIELLRKRGYDLVGIDLSLKMLKIAYHSSSKRYVQADVRFLPFTENSFDAAFSLHGAFAHLKSREERNKGIEEISHTIKPGGQVFIDVPNPYREEGGKSYTIEWPAGDNKIRTTVYRTYLEEFEEILRENSFKIERMIGSYDLEDKFTKNSRRLIVIGNKTSPAG